MIGIFFMRYNLVHDTLIYPMQTLKVREYQLPPGFVGYFPSATEFAIGFGGVGIALFLYYVANKVFNLDDTPSAHH
jgi:molybdopterin-containing oxidoreductase family membrane subunit